jgi:hypothetical protein
MRAIMESLFDVAYLVTVIAMGIAMLRRKQQLFGIMTIILGGGDSFHLIPRVFALWNGGTDAYVAALGFGTLVTSITMTIYYVLLYHVWQRHYDKPKKHVLSFLIYILAALRILLCLLPQNEWFRADSPLAWGIYRNIPFLAIGIIMVVLFAAAKAKAGAPPDPFRLMAPAIALSFAFYIPVVLWADAYPMIGMLMIPKTCVYVWMTVMGLKSNDR